MAQPTTSLKCTPENLCRLRAAGLNLEGALTELVPLSKKHLSAAYVSWFNDPEVTRYTRHGVETYTMEKACAYFERIQHLDNSLVFAVHRRSDGRHVGNISLNDISWTNHAGEISVILGEKECWGQGLGAEAVGLVSSFAFQDLDLHRLFLGMTAENDGMIRIAAKNGYREEGVLRHAFCKNGTYKDITQWSRINPRHAGGT